MSGAKIAADAHEAGHDHAACIDAAMRRAERVCAASGLRLTAMRRHVLELIWVNHKPSKAYDLLDLVRQDHGRAAPPTVYRALDFLQSAGLAHHLESLDAFVGCDLADCAGSPQFLICRNCQRVAEMASQQLTYKAEQEAETMGFRAEREVIEMHGLCSACQRTSVSGH